MILDLLSILLRLCSLLYLFHFFLSSHTPFIEEFAVVSAAVAAAACFSLAESLFSCRVPMLLWRARALNWRSSMLLRFSFLSVEHHLILSSRHHIWWWAGHHSWWLAAASSVLQIITHSSIRLCAVIDIQSFQCSLLGKRTLVKPLMHWWTIHLSLATLCTSKSFLVDDLLWIRTDRWFILIWW